MYNMNAAITALTKANGISMKSGQADPALLSELAECHVGTGNYEKASGIYFILTSTLPQNMYYRISQAMMMYMMKEYDSAADVCRTILAKDSTIGGCPEYPGRILHGARRCGIRRKALQETIRMQSL